MHAALDVFEVMKRVLELVDMRGYEPAPAAVRALVASRAAWNRQFPVDDTHKD